MNPPTSTATTLISWLPLITTIIVVVAGITYQWLSHYFTQSREEKKYKIEAYQKLFAPVLIDAFLYYDMRTNFKRGHDTSIVVEYEKLSKVIDHIGENLIYASPELLSAYHFYILSQTADLTGFHPSYAQVGLLRTFLEEFNALNQSVKLFRNPRGDTDTLLYYRAMYELWGMLAAKVGPPIAANMLRYSWCFDKRAVTPKFYKKLQNLRKDTDSLEDIVRLAVRELMPHTPDPFRMSRNDVETHMIELSQELVIDDFQMLQNEGTLVLQNNPPPTPQSANKDWYPID